MEELKALLPKADEEGKRPASPLDAEIAALEEVRSPMRIALSEFSFLVWWHDCSRFWT